MATGTQIVKIHRTSDGAELYTATTRRDTNTYPLTSAGDAAFGEAASNGSFDLTVDNGAIIHAGTIPPLTKPGGGNPPSSYYKKIQSEQGSPDVTGTGSKDGTAPTGDDVVMGQYITSSDYLDYHLTDVPQNGNYNLAIRYQTNTQATGIGTVIVNNGTPVDFNLEGAEGGKRTYNMSITLNSGVNVIRIQGKSGTTFFQDYIIVTKT